MRLSKYESYNVEVKAEDLYKIRGNLCRQPGTENGWIQLYHGEISGFAQRFEVIFGIIVSIIKLRTPLSIF